MRKLVSYVLVGATLILAFIIDETIQPRDQFVSTPFAVAVLIATFLLPVRAVVLTSILALLTATFAAHLDNAPAIPAIFHLSALAIIGVLAVLLGMERREAARRTRDAEQERARALAVIQSAANAIIYVDAASEAVLANREAVYLFGHPITAEGGRLQYAGQILPPDGRPLAIADIPSSRALRGETIPQHESIIQRPDGSRVPVLQSAAPVRGPNGEILGAVVVFQDISAIKELDRLREEWTSIIAHDLRQPITVISAYASLLAREIRATAEPAERDALNHVIAAARNLNKMVGDLLDVSRIEARRLRIECQPTNLAQLVRSVMERNASITRGHDVRITVATAIPTIEVDPSRIEQILGNLISNAAKYGYPDSEIDLDLRRVDGVVEISVTNRGPGISPQELPRLFTRFYRPAAVRLPGATGIGLGLYIAKGLVEAHHGRISVQSVPGEQTMFTVSLPITPSSTEQARPASRSE